MSSGDIFLKIINLEHRRDRRDECVEELACSGISAGDDFFFKAYNKPEFGALGASLSHANLIASYLTDSECPYLIVLEDDFEIFDKESFLSDLTKAISFSDEWDVFLLSHNQAIPISVVDKENSFCRVINSQTASGYIVKRQFAVKLMGIFFDSVVGLKNILNIDSGYRGAVKHFYCLDILWKNLQTDFNFVTRFPAILKQRASYSDIEKKHVDYGV